MGAFFHTHLLHSWVRKTPTRKVHTEYIIQFQSQEFVLKNNQMLSYHLYTESHDGSATRVYE